MGINDLVFIIFSSVITDTLSPAFSLMPAMVLFAKITPVNIEATVFAFVTGINNFSTTVLSPYMGAMINKHFVKVTNDNLEDIYILVMISLGLLIIPVMFIWLIPLRDDLEVLQKQFE
jgi:hypothetical protein